MSYARNSVLSFLIKKYSCVSIQNHEALILFCLTTLISLNVISNTFLSRVRRYSPGYSSRQGTTLKQSVVSQTVPYNFGQPHSVHSHMESDQSVCTVIFRSDKNNYYWSVWNTKAFGSDYYLSSNFVFKLSLLSMFLH